MAEQSGVTFEMVSKAATAMLTQGTKPSVRGVMQVTGGKTETVSKHLRDFNDKRNAEVLKMADELGSSKIAQLLADEIQSVVERKTASLQQIIADQKSQLDEAIELLEEKERECQHRNELVSVKALQDVKEANERAQHAESKVVNFEQAAESATEEAEKARAEAATTIAANENKCTLLIDNAKAEAAALVKAANHRTDKAEQEATTLREQVSSLSVDQAKREIEQAQYQQTLEQFTSAQQKLADEKTRNVRLQTQHDSYSSEVKRLSSELAEARQDSKNLGITQGELVAIQKQLSQAQNELALSERERESLTLALSKVN